MIFRKELEPFTTKAEMASLITTKAEITETGHLLMAGCFT